MRKFISCQAGMTLIESVICVALLGIVITGLVAGLSAGFLSGHQVEERTLAANLARSQLEDTKAQPYVEPPVYPAITPPEGYSIAVDGSVNTTGLLEVITVTVSNSEKTLIEVTGYKVNMAAVTTTPSPAVTIASDDFESDDWESGSGWLDEWYHSGDASIRSGGDPHGGEYHLRLRRSNGYVDRAVDLSGRTNVHLQFWAKVDSFEGGDSAGALVSPDDVNWTVVKTWTASDSDNTYQFVDIDLSGFTMSSEFWIAFDAEMNSKNDHLYIDDLEIVSQPALALASGDESPGTLLVDGSLISGGTYTIDFYNASDSAITAASYSSSGDDEGTWIYIKAYKDYLITSEAGSNTITVLARQTPGPTDPTTQQSVAIEIWRGS